MTPAPARLDVRDVSKTFGRTRVLTDVALTIQPGDVHGLAGQNGSGKSTLTKVLTGLHPADAGARYWVDGVSMRSPVRWRNVHAAGVSVVHQDLGLLDQLTVAENVCVGGFPTSRLRGHIDRRRRDELTARTLARLGVELAPTRLVASLSASERAEVAIARAVRDLPPGTGLIILDEATRALAGEDLTRVHALLRRITDDGSAALLISHNLGELKAVTDRMTILRDGRLACSAVPTRELSEAEIARLMLGSAVTALEASAPEPRAARQHDITVRELRGRRVRDVAFSVGRGEVLGVTGLPGNGYEEIPYLLTGAQPAAAGEISADATTLDLRRTTVNACMSAGIVLVPERRDRDGLAFELDVRDNLALPALRRRGRPWFVARRWQYDQADAALARLDIRPRTPSILVKALSGGNQQKVLLAKWLGVGPRLLVLHEPTQAVDVGARVDILRAVQGAARSGTAVVMVSSEPEDLAAVCDRVLVYEPHLGLRPARSQTPDGLIEHVYGTTRPAGDAP